MSDVSPAWRALAAWAARTPRPKPPEWPTEQQCLEYEERLLAWQLGVATALAISVRSAPADPSSSTGYDAPPCA
jgi:hypothetical protein